MKFTRKLAGWLHAAGVVITAASVNQVAGVAPAVPAVIPDQVAPWLAIGIPVVQAIMGHQAFNFNWNGSPASLPAPAESPRIPVDGH